MLGTVKPAVVMPSGPPSYMFECIGVKSTGSRQGVDKSVKLARRQAGARRAGARRTGAQASWGRRAEGRPQAATAGELGLGVSAARLFRYARWPPSCTV